MVTLTRTDTVSVLSLGTDENRFTLDWLDAVEATLDEAFAAGDPLLTTAEGKFFSNGLDVALLGETRDLDAEYPRRVERLLARMLTAPVPTVAAINGHCFGAGALLALAHDTRLMNAGRGFFCFPEVDIRIPFTDGMSALIQAKLTPAAAVESMTTGRRYGGSDAAKRGLVDGAVAPDELRGSAVELATSIGRKDSATLGTIKATMFADAARRLLRPPAAT